MWLEPGRDETPDMVVLTRDLRAPRRARAWLARLYGEELSADALSDAQLVVSELVSNALRHGLGDVVLRTSLDDTGCLTLAVSDSGTGDPHLVPVDPERIGGLGLIVVDRLAASWGAESFPNGKTVWARIATPPPG